MIRIAVAEDDLSWAKQLQAYVEQYARETGKPFDEIGRASCRERV